MNCWERKTRSYLGDRLQGVSFVLLVYFEISYIHFYIIMDGFAVLQPIASVLRSVQKERRSA